MGSVTGIGSGSDTGGVGSISATGGVSGSVNGTGRGSFAKGGAGAGSAVRAGSWAGSRAGSGIVVFASAVVASVFQPNRLTSAWDRGSPCAAAAINQRLASLSSFVAPIPI